MLGSYVLLCYYKLFMQEICLRCKHHSFTNLGLLLELQKKCMVKITFLYLFFCVKFHEKLNREQGLNTMELKRGKKKHHDKQGGPCCYHEGPLVFLSCPFFSFSFSPIFFPFICRYSNNDGSRNHHHYCQQFELLAT